MSRKLTGITNNTRRPLCLLFVLTVLSACGYQSDQTKPATKAGQDDDRSQKLTILAYDHFYRQQEALDVVDVDCSQEVLARLNVRGSEIIAPSQNKNCSKFAALVVDRLAKVSKVLGDMADEFREAPPNLINDPQFVGQTKLAYSNYVTFNAFGQAALQILMSLSFKMSEGPKQDAYMNVMNGQQAEFDDISIDARQQIGIALSMVAIQEGIEGVKKTPRTKPIPEFQSPWLTYNNALPYRLSAKVGQVTLTQ